MANTITGFILSIGATVQVPTKNGVPFQKRELLLDCSSYDRFTGEKRENYPLMEFTQNNCQKLDSFKAGDLVTVSFVLSGVKYEKDGQVNYFTHVKGYDIALYSRNGQPQTVQQPVAAPAPVQNPPYTSPSAPTGMSSAQPFPPAVDEDGNPINSDDLPF